MTVDVNTLTTKLNGRGIAFKDFFFNASSHVLGMIFYDQESLWNPWSELKPKDISSHAELLEDGFTIKWRDSDWRRQGATVDGIVAGAATKVDVATGTGVLFAAGDLIYFPSTNESRVITSISTDELTLHLALSASGLADGVDVEVLSSTIDSAGTVNGKTSDIQVWAEQTNYITEVSHKVTFSNVELNKALLRYTAMGVDDNKAVANYVADRMKKVKQEMVRDNLRNLYFGKKFSATVAGKVHRTTGGFSEYQDSTVVDVATESTDIDKWTKLVSAFNAVSKLAPVDAKGVNTVLVVNEQASEEIDSWILGLAIQKYTQQVSSLGWKVDKLKTGYGAVTIMTCPELSQMTKSDTFGTGFIFCPELISMVTTTQFLTPDTSGSINGDLVPVSKPWIQFFIPEGDRKQPNSDVTMNAYSNFWFAFQGNTLDMFKKVKF